nr:hypothetical protein [Tanacetum cinerariifolium]
MDQNINFSGSDQIQTPQYPEIHPPSQEISDEVFQANHSDQYKENLENSSNFNQEKEGPLQDSDIRQLIREECCIKVCEEQKQNMKDTILELVKICRQKKLLCMHDNVDDLIESALNSKLLSINSQHLNKKKQKVKNVVEQPAEHGTQHPNTTSEMESNEIIKSGVEELVPIQSECEVTLEDESKCDMPIQDQSSSVFMTFSSPIFKDNDDLTSSDDESLSEEDVPIEESKVYSNPLFDDDEINSDELESHVESNFVESLSNHDALIESSQNIDYLEEFSEIAESDFDFEEEIHLIDNLLYDNSSSRPPEEHNAEEECIKKEHADYISRMDMLFAINPNPRPTVNANTIVESIPSSLIPGEVDVVEELHVDNSISNAKNELSDNETSDFDNPSFPRPPSKPHAEFDLELDSKKEISVVMNAIRDEFDVSNDENDDYCSFMFVI